MVNKHVTNWQVSQKHNFIKIWFYGEGALPVFFNITDKLFKTVIIPTTVFPINKTIILPNISEYTFFYRLSLVDILTKIKSSS